MRVNRKPTTTARKVAIATCNGVLFNLDNRKVQRTPSFGGGHKSVAVVVAVMVVALSNRTGRYASQWRRRARGEHSVVGSSFEVFV